ncbi:hypothetical protein R77567_00884 [Ralstonia sp. LMG 32965]|uniref:Cell wall anchor protein n=2 Tax=Ralstonia flatus TaxID=3058601 RepID=A0AAD2C4K4_9RALS|nr:hypothetical protein R77567_00884 [Ralstonia sp. LMG 32965]CAJ0865649.1 hypothetical protein R77564_01218 [Ralstonia sp. LMG 32965]
MKARYAKSLWQMSSAATAIALAAVTLVAGCGGGGSDSAASGGTNTTTPAAATLTGTAATGSALANANVVVTDSTGNSPCVETAITTSALGTYTCTLKSGETAPFFVVVTDPTGNTAPLVSVTTTTPPAGTPLTLNATPLTTAILAQLAPDGNPLTLVNAKTVDTNALKAVTANVVAQLSSVLSAIGAPANYDPFATSISAATASGVGNTADQILDVVTVSKDPATGQLRLGTVDGTPVPLATATGGGSTLPAPASNVSSLPQGAQALANALTACFALPASQRVLGTDFTVPATQGGPKVTSLAPACQNIASDPSNAGGIAFLHNGYAFGQWFLGYLMSDSMTGAKFSVPEVMAFYPAGSPSSPTYDTAILNTKFVDASGNPGNIIVLARYIASGTSAAHPSNWWVVGNQQPVEINERLQVRRVEQVNPNFAGTSANSNNYSHFQTGIQFWINAKGPGSVNNNGNLNFVRVTGPGLPTNGLVYIAPTGDSNEPTQVYMDVSNKSGTVPATTRCSNGGTATYNCPNFWFARTVGLTGSAATTLAAPRSDFSNPVWAQASDSLDPNPVVKNARYQFELFYGSQTTPDRVYHKTLLTDLVQATQAVNLPWNTAGNQTLAALNPSNAATNGVLSSLALDWAQNPSAQQIGGAAVTVDTKGTYSATTNVARGATSAVINLPNPQQVPALTTSGTRSVLFNYRMLDNSLKSMVYTYN